MKKEQDTTPQLPVNKGKLYLGILFLILAMVAVLVVVILPDKPTKKAEPTKQEAVNKLAFVKEGSASFFAKDGKMKSTFDIEIADTPERQKQGLMYRESMYDTQAMLFPYDNPSNQSFWMKNTYLPLDIIFIGADSTIMTIAENTTPFSEETISSQGLALSVLEINAGLSKKLNLAKGDKFNWKKD